MSPADVFTPEDYALACQVLFGGLNGLGAEPVEYRVACAIAAARLGATHPVVVLPRRDREAQS